jgi:hypothetical protein
MKHEMRRAARLTIPVCLILVAAVAARSAPVVAEIAVCLGVDAETRAPVGAATTFTPGTKRLFCYTRITGCTEPTAVEHVWYRAGETVARIRLDVGSSDWRTWSSKRLLRSWAGDWEIKVLDAEGLVLASSAFRIEPAASATGEGE